MVTLSIDIFAVLNAVTDLPPGVEVNVLITRSGTQMNGQEYNLTCVVNREDARYFQWLKDGIQQRERTSTVLYFPHLTEADSGEYTCEVTIGFRTFTSPGLCISIGGGKSYSSPAT